MLHVSKHELVILQNHILYSPSALHTLNLNLNDNIQKNISFPCANANGYKMELFLPPSHPAECVGGDNITTQYYTIVTSCIP